VPLGTGNELRHVGLSFTVKIELACGLRRVKAYVS
jgi:hypothetical protein